MWSLVCAALASPLVSAAQDMPTRPEKRESSHKPPPSVRWPTLLGGVGFTAGWWGIATATSYLDETSPGMTQLRYPVVGPWLGLRDNSCQGDCSFGYYFRGFWFIFTGIAQAGGLGVALESLLVPTEPYTPPKRSPAPAIPAGPSPSTSPNPSPSPSPPPATPVTPNKDIYWVPSPMPVGATGLGVGVLGTF